MNRDQCLKRKINPRETANVVSLVSFFYTIKLFIRGYTQGLEIEDIYEVLPSLRTKESTNKLEREWEEEKRKNLEPRVVRPLWTCFWKPFVLINIIQFVVTMTMTVWSPKALSKLVSYFSPGQTDLTKEDATFYACTLIGLHFINTFVKSNLRLAKTFISIRMKAVVSSLIYRKSLKLSSESISDVTTGKILTIITKDLDIVDWCMVVGSNICIAFLQTCLICCLIYNQIGGASLPGIGFFFLVMPLQILIAKMGYRLRLKCSKKSDERLELIREILSAIKIIKMYTWENFFETKVNIARKAELKQLHKLFYTKVTIIIVGALSSKIAFFIFLMTYVWMDNNITAEIVYYILSCINDLEASLTTEIPSGFGYVAELWAVLKRVDSVLLAKELPTSNKNDTETDNPEIIFKKVNSGILEIDNLGISKGLSVVVGHVGCGKTTFLKTILHDCHHTGEVHVDGRVSYASQEPWLFPSTIRNNILFGRNFDEKRYQEVLKVCCLDYDLKILPESDGTLVGDRGINLSRGQQARVNLARAIYKNCEIYLLDDCLASLDGHVSDTIFKRCICGFLKDKLRVVVTNNLDYIKSADKVIEISALSLKLVENTKTEYFCEEIYEETSSSETGQYTSKQLYQEKKRSGVVPLKCYKQYINYGGGFIVFSLIICLFIAAQSTSSSSEKILSNWVTLEQNFTNYNEINQTLGDDYEGLYEEKTTKLTLYITIALSSIFLTLVKYFAFYQFTRRACVNVHKAVVRGVINTTMKFFDSHFIGNIFTRFTKDFVSVDETLPFITMDCISMFFTASGGVILLTTVDYVFLLESIFLLIVAIAIKQFCQPTGRNLERLHIIARSPINGHLNSTLEGLTTIRAYGAQSIVKDEFDEHQDLFNSAYCMVVTNYTSLMFFLDFLCKVFISVIIIQFLIFDLDVSVGDVGLVITQSFVITGIITSGVLSVADFENLNISTERILQFTELEQERQDGNVVAAWPKSGLISLDNVSLSYDNSKQEMLSDINFVIKPRTKLGVVGRTGAGKSSIIAALFRLYEFQGKITIDEVDIQDLRLNQLRSSISVIPQEPYLFSGTIRENLDPMMHRRDEEIWKILDDLNLKVFINDLNAKIDKSCHFSAGQKQLLCLARAVLRESKIVVLDEATANVDEETDTLIRQIVLKYFKRSTQIIIAHRLTSVMSCENVVVLNNGCVMEFGEPVKLMENKKSFFSRVMK